EGARRKREARSERVAAGFVLFANAGVLQCQLPYLRDQAVAEVVVRLLRDEAVALLLVDPPCRDEDRIGPQRDRVIAHLPRETRALVDQSAADAEPARTRLDEQHPQLRHPLAFRMLHEHHRADVLAILLRNPAALTLWIEVADEVRDDLRDARLEPLVPAVLAVVEHTVAVHDPTHVAR